MPKTQEKSQKNIRVSYQHCHLVELLLKNIYNEDLLAILILTMAAI